MLRLSLSIYREEDESDLDPAVSIKSQDGGSLADNTAGSDVIQKGNIYVCFST